MPTDKFESLNRVASLTINTRIPSKWLAIDLATGSVWRGSGSGKGDATWTIATKEERSLGIITLLNEIQ